MHIMSSFFFFSSFFLEEEEEEIIWQSRSVRLFLFAAFKLTADITHPHTTKQLNN